MITSKVCDSFLRELLAMSPHAAGDTYKVILIKTGHAGTYDEETTAVGTPGTGTPTTSNIGTDAVAVSGDYSSVNGIALTGFSVITDVDHAVLTFDDPAVLGGTTISADGAIIYNSSKENRACGVFAFPDAPVITSGGNFTITLPAQTAAAGLIKITSGS